MENVLELLVSQETLQICLNIAIVGSMIGGTLIGSETKEFFKTAFSAKLLNLLMENEFFKKPLIAMIQEEIKQFQDKIDELQDQVETMKNEKNENGTKMQELEEKLEQLKNEKILTENKIRDLQHDIDSMKIEKNDDHGKLRDLQYQIDNLKSERNSDECKIRDLRNEIQNIENKKNNHEEMDVLKNKIESLEREKSFKEDELSNKIQELEHKIENSNVDNTEIDTENQKVVQELQTQLHSLEKEKDSQLTEIKHEIEKLKNEKNLTESENIHKGDKIIELQNEIEYLKNEKFIDEKERQKDKMFNDLIVGKMEECKNDLKKDHDMMEEKNKIMNNEIKGYNKELSNKMIFAEKEECFAMKENNQSRKSFRPRDKNVGVPRYQTTNCSSKLMKYRSIMGCNYEQTDIVSSKKPKTTIFATYFSLNTTKLQLETFIRKQLNSEDIFCEEINPKSKSKTYKSFRIVVNEDLIENLYDPKIWPQGVLVKEYEYNRYKKGYSRFPA